MKVCLQKKICALAFSMLLFIFSGCSQTGENQVTVDDTEVPTNSMKNHVCSPAEVQDQTKQTAGSGFKILILMYHNIVTGIPTSEYDRKKSDFENDLKFLKSKNYQFISFEDLLKIKAGQMQLTSNAIILSFDDGYASWYTKAFPLLKKHNLPATFFIVPEWIGTPNYMKWPEVWNIRSYKNTQNQSLFSIHSHTASHPFLKKWGEGKDPAIWQNFLNLQLGESRDWIVDITQQPSLFLALPYGDGAGDSTIIATAKSKGYDGIRTSVRASFTEDNIDLFNLPSVVILSTAKINTVENYF